MQYEILEEIDYEHLDDLPLFEHIEWQYQEGNNFTTTPTELLFYFKKFFHPA